MKTEKSNLVDKCLIATPAIKDPIFASSLVYICEHSEHGSMGLVINHKTTQTLEDLLSQLDIQCDDESIKQKPLFIGGPVQLEQGFEDRSSRRLVGSELAIAVGLLGILFIILVKLPPGVMDALLIVNITVSLLILLTTACLRNPLELSV